MNKALRPLILIALLSACTEKGRPIHRHEADKRGSSEDSATKLSDANSPASNVQGLTLQQLADRVLDINRIRDPKSRTNRAIQDELLAFNSLLLKNPDEKVLKRVATALDTDCDSVSSSCFGVLYFRQAANSSQVAKLAAMKSKDDQESTRLLLTAIAMKGAEYDSQLIELLLEKSSQVMKSVPEKLREALTSALNTGLTTANLKNQDRGELKRFLSRIHIWEIIDNPSWQLSEGATAALWSMVARAKLLPGKGEIGSPEYEKFAQKQSEDQNSIIRQQKEMRAKGMFKPSSLGATFIEKLDVLSLIVDAVFTGRLTPSSAAIVFGSSERSAVELENAVTTYMRLRFALTVHAANLEMEKIVKADVTTEQLIFHAIKQSPAIKKFWDDLYVNLQRVQNFSSTALKAAKDGDAPEKRIVAMFGTYHHQVNLTGVYPHMLVLLYHLSQKNFDLSQFGSGLNTTVILSYLYFGNLPPILDYGKEKRALSYFEVLYAFDTALRTNLFKTAGIDVDDFIANSLKRLTENPATVVREKLDLIKNFYQESPRYNDFRAACAEFTTGYKAPRIISLPELSRLPYYGILMEIVNKTVSDIQTHHIGFELPVTKRGFFYGDQNIAEATELIRLDFAQHERTARAMMASYGSYLKDTAGLSSEAIAEKFPKTNKVLENLNSLRRRLLTEVAVYETEQGACKGKMNRRNAEVQMKLIALEKERLRRIHGAIKNLREGKPAGFSLKFEGLPSDYTGREFFDEGGYNTNEIDLQINIAKNLVKLEPQIQINYGATLDLERNDVRKASLEQRRIYYTENPEDFVNAALQTYMFIHSSWLRYDDHMDDRHAWPEYIKSLVSMYRLEQALYGKNVIVSAERILDAHEDLIRTMNIGPEQRDLLIRSKRQGIVSQNAFNDRLFNYSQNIMNGVTSLQDTWALLDLPAYFMNEERLGVDFEIAKMGFEVPASAVPRRFGYRELARRYYTDRAKLSRGNPIIPFSPVVDQYLDTELKNWVGKETGAIKHFFKVIEKRAADHMAVPARDRLKADLTLDKTMTEIYSPAMSDNAKARIEKLDKDTHGCFVRQCDDFQ